MRRATALVLGFFCAVTAASEPAAGAPIAPDPLIQARELAPGDPQRLLLDLTFGRPGAADRLRRRLLSPSNLGGDFKRRGWLALCEAGYQAGRYRQAIGACRNAVAADPSDSVDAANTLLIVTGLRDERPIRATGAAKVPFISDDRIPVSIAGQDSPAIVDTGAEISVMMESVARRAGVRRLGVRLQMGTTTAPVMAELGIIHRVQIGDASIFHIPVAILPDAQLSFDDGKVQLPFVLGLYSLEAFGRVAWLEHAGALALGSKTPWSHGVSAQILWHPLGLAVPLQGPGGTRSAQLDTGADQTYLFDRGLDLLSAAERTTARVGERSLTGVGGVRREKIEKVSVATLILAGAPLGLRDVVVAPQIESGEAARLGFDMLKHFAVVAIDFDRMKIFVRP